MKKHFRNYQTEAFKFCMNAAHIPMLMEMRLGKTLVAIRRCMLYAPATGSAETKILVVAPNSALKSWLDELQSEGETNVVILCGTKVQRLALLSSNAKWFLLNKEGHRALPEIADINWDVVILDESTFIKNPKAAVTKFFTKHFRTVPHRWILTGKPNPQSELDWYCQMQFLFGEAFGYKSYWAFRADCFQPGFNHNWNPKLHTMTMMKKWIAERAFVLRRKDAALDVPKIYERRIITLPPAIRKLYDTLEDEFILADQQDNVLKKTDCALVRLCWLRQLCNGFSEGKLIWDGKIKEIISLLTTELQDESVVLWFNFNEEIQVAFKALRKIVSCRWMDGTIKPKDRRAIQADFQSRKFRVLLTQQGIAQSGMDLSAADTSIFIGTPLGVEARSQTEDRILTVNKKGILIIDILVDETVDVDLLDTLKSDNASSNFTLQRVRKLAMQRRKVANG